MNLSSVAYIFIAMSAVTWDKPVYYAFIATAFMAIGIYVSKLR